MDKAYVLINCESGYEAIVAKSIESLDDIATCNIVYGVYDIIVEVTFDTLQELEYIVKKKIRNINKIQSTMTLIPWTIR